MYSAQRTGVIYAKPTVRIQSASASPGIAIAPRAVVEVPMAELLKFPWLTMGRRSREQEWILRLQRDQPWKTV